MDPRGTPFTVDSVARAASVTRQTVHNHFGTRAALLGAVSDSILDMGAFASMPEVFHETDPIRALELFAEVLCRFWGANLLLARRLRGYADTDPEVEAMTRTRFERRLAALRGLVERHRLAEGEEAERLMGVLFAVTSFGFYDALAECAPSEQEIEREIKRVLRLCLADARRPRGERQV